MHGSYSAAIGMIIGIRILSTLLVLAVAGNAPCPNHGEHRARRCGTEGPAYVCGHDPSIIFFQGSFSFVYLNFNPLFLCTDVLFIMLTSKNNTLGKETRRGVKDYPEIIRN
jgi:hypothetical protein